MQKPKNLLIYYGWTNSFNSARNQWDNEKVAQDMVRYDMIVLGNGIQDPSHGDYTNSLTIINRLKALNPDIMIFGYVTVNQDFVSFSIKVGQWDAMAVNGIFMDEAGYDFGKNRADFNQKVDYVHSMSISKICFANAWNSDHILGTADDLNFPNATFNPTSTASNLNASDWILLESFPVNTAAFPSGYESAADWKVRGDKAISLKSQFGVNFAGVGVIDNVRADGSALFSFGYVSAVMYSLGAFGSSDVNYGASSAAVRYWARPSMVSNITSSVQQDIADSNIYSTCVGDENASLKFTDGQQSSILQNNVFSYGSLYAANLGQMQAITVAPVKLVKWSNSGISNRMTVDLVNSRIVIQVSGIYQVNFSISASTSVGGNVDFHLRRNGVEMPEFGTKVKFTTALANAVFTNFGSFSVGDILEIHVGGVNANMTVHDSQLIVRKIN